MTTFSIDNLNKRDINEFIKDNTKQFGFLNSREYNSFVPAPCKNCPNHPLNGGTGICHCILGTLVMR